MRPDQGFAHSIALQDHLLGEHLFEADAGREIAAGAYHLGLFRVQLQQRVTGPFRFRRHDAQQPYRQPCWCVRACASRQLAEQAARGNQGIDAKGSFALGLNRPGASGAAGATGGLAGSAIDVARGSGDGAPHAQVQYASTRPSNDSATAFDVAWIAACTRFDRPDGMSWFPCVRMVWMVVARSGFPRGCALMELLAGWQRRDQAVG